MKYAMYNRFTELVWDWGIEKAAEYAAAHGFEAVEFLDLGRPPAETVEEARRMRCVLEEKGLKTACYSVGLTLYGSPEAEEKLMTSAQLAAALGSPYLHHTLATPYVPLAEGLDFETVLAEVLPRALRVAEYAGGLGVMCLYEEQGYYFNGISQFGRFFREMQKRTDNVGVCGDFGNILFVGGEPPAFLKAFARDVRHVHIKDYRVTDAPVQGVSLPYRDGTWLTETVAGTGIADAESCVRLLKEAGYDGYAALELAFSFPEEYEQAVEETIAFVESVWRKTQ